MEKNKGHNVQKCNIHLYQVKGWNQTASITELQLKKKDVYAQNKQNNEYETAPSQFCWHEKSLHELFVHD